MKRNEFLKQYISGIENAAEQLKERMMPDLSQELFLQYEKTGNRLEYEKKYFERRRFLAVFGMRSILSEQQENIAKLEEIIREICEEKCWALPAHVQTSKRNWERTVELYACETGQALAEIVHILGAKLNESIRTLVFANCMQRVLEPFFQSAVPYAFWEQTQMNWAAVCGGSIGMMVLDLFPDNPHRIEQWIERVDEIMIHYINGFTEEGACREGFDYWTYGMTYFTAYMEKRIQYNNGYLNPLKSKRMLEIMEFGQKCYFRDGTSISFSDGSTHSAYRMGLFSFLHHCDRKVEIPQNAEPMLFDTDPCYHWAGIYRDVFWTQKFAEIPVDTREHIWVLPDAQWLIASGNRGSFAIKGGNNDEPHNHNDIGTFIYCGRMTEWICDLGAGEYCRDYFNENRYHILSNGAQGHTVPVIDATSQKQGRDYRCSSFRATDRQGHMLNPTSGDVSVTLDLTDAYDWKQEKRPVSVTRNAQFSLSSGILTVVDHFQGTAGSLIEERLITRQKCRIRKNQIILTALNESDHGCCMIMIQGIDGEIHKEEKIYKNHEGGLETVSVISWNVAAWVADASECECRKNKAGRAIKNEPEYRMNKASKADMSESECGENKSSKADMSEPECGENKASRVDTSEPEYRQKELCQSGTGQIDSGQYCCTMNLICREEQI